MYRKVIVGFDGRAQWEDAVALGKLLADASAARLVLAEVFSFSPTFGERDPVLQDIRAAHTRRLEEAAASVGAEAEAVASSSPALGLHHLAEDDEADLLVVGSAHRGKLGQILAGSVGLRLLPRLAVCGRPRTARVCRRGSETHR